MTNIGFTPGSDLVHFESEMTDVSDLSCEKCEEFKKCSQY